MLDPRCDVNALPSPALRLEVLTNLRIPVPATEACTAWDVLVERWCKGLQATEAGIERLLASAWSSSGARSGADKHGTWVAKPSRFPIAPLEDAEWWQAIAGLRRRSLECQEPAQFTIAMALLDAAFVPLKMASATPELINATVGKIAAALASVSRSQPADGCFALCVLPVDEPHAAVTPSATNSSSASAEAASKGASYSASLKVPDGFPGGLVAALGTVDTVLSLSLTRTLTRDSGHGTKPKPKPNPNLGQWTRY